MPYAPGSRQYEWVREQLAAVNRTETPWLIVSCRASAWLAA